jgi:hypothetical protein
MGNKKITPLPISYCPMCGHLLDSATVIGRRGKREPRSGDISLCIECAEVLVYAEGMVLERADLNDLMDLKPQQRQLLGQAQKLIRARGRLRNWPIPP